LSDEGWTAEFGALLAAAGRSGGRASSGSADRDEQVRLLEAAVRLADHHGDEVRGFAARDELITAATFGGQRDRALVAFAWCRARHKQDPQRFGWWNVLWRNKWAVDGLPEHLGVTRAQILEAQDDYAAAVEQAGGNVKSVAKLRMGNALQMGDPEEAKRWYPIWRDTPRDLHADCRACDATTEVEALVTFGEQADALMRAVPILAGRLSCAEVPHLTFGWLVEAHFHLGHLEEARDAFLRGYRLILKNRAFLPSVGRMLAFLALTDNSGPALTLVERHLGWALDARSSLAAVPFYLAGRFLLERIAASGQAEVAVQLPKGFPLHREAGIYETRALHDWFEGRIVELSSRFDARNGNDFYMKRLDQSRGWAADVRPFPVTRGVG
jgi:hypothetical protein